MEKVGSYKFLSEPFHCDFTHRLFLGHLGNHMLNAADYHSCDRGFGMSYLNTVNKTWVLSRLAIEMDEYPLQYAAFNVETWVEGVMRNFTDRSFRVVGDDGTVYGYGKSIWALIDTETRQPQDLLKLKDGEIVQWVDKERVCPIRKCSRVTMGDAATLVRTVDTQYSDIDVNGHVNSVKYIEHVLDLFQLEWYRTHSIKRFEMAYIAESYFGDSLNFYMEDCGDGIYNVRIVKVDKNTEKMIEVCRSSIAFVNK